MTMTNEVQDTFAPAQLAPLR